MLQFSHFFSDKWQVSASPHCNQCQNTGPGVKMNYAPKYCHHFVIGCEKSFKDYCFNLCPKGKIQFVTLYYNRLNASNWFLQTLLSIKNCKQNHDKMIQRYYICIAKFSNINDFGCKSSKKFFENNHIFFSVYIQDFQSTVAWEILDKIRIEMSWLLLKYFFTFYIQKR